MTETHIEPTVELLLGEDWTDISSFVAFGPSDSISITRGRQNEGTQVEPSICTLTLNNRDGRFTPRNPTGPYYGLIGRNTPLRVTVADSIRILVEVSAWPQTWNDTGVDVWTPVQAAGVLRRLGQGQPAAQTGVRTYAVETTQAMHIYPGDTPNDLGGLSFHQGLVLNNCAAFVHFGQGDMGDGFPAGMLIDKTNLVTGNVYPKSGYISASLGAGTGGTFNAAGFVFKGSTLGSMAFYLTAYGTLGPGGYVALFDAAAGTVTLFRITYDPDADGFTVALIDASVAGLQFYTDGALHSMLWTIVDTGSSLTHTLYIDGVDIAAGVDATGPSSLQGMAAMQLSYDPTGAIGGTGAVDGGPIAISYLTFWADQYGSTLPDPTDWAQAADGYIGETAGNRLARLCDENDLSFTYFGDLDDTTPMGPQGTGDLVSTLNDAAGTDQGILYEPRDGFPVGFRYRPRTTLYNQDPAVTLDYTSGVLGSAPDVTDDDQAIRNDVTVTNTGGGSARAVLTEGPLSVQPPPDGVGTYSTSVNVNVVTAGLLPDQASWRLALGTIDEARWPGLHLNVMNPAISGDEDLLAAVLELDLGDLLTVTDLPAWLPPGDVALLAQGYTETISPNGWDLTLNCSPASPYSVAVWADPDDPQDDDAHYDAEDSTTNSSATTTTTSMSVASAAHTELWTTDDDDFPFDIGIAGEQITVTDISGASSPQSFTVTRSVNGVVKAHSAGEQVRLWTTPRYAL